jgi:hypothetical protein
VLDFIDAAFGTERLDVEIGEGSKPGLSSWALNRLRARCCSIPLRIPSSAPVTAEL